MDLLDSLNILMKRWWLTLPIFFLTLVGVGAAVLALPWSYEAKATVVFLASPVQSKQAGGNPWLVFDGSLTVTAEVVGREMMDDRTVAAFKAQGLTSTYLVGVAPNSTGPVLAVDVTGKDNANTAATLNAVMKMIPEKLAQIQADGGVTPSARIRLNVIGASPQPTLKATSKIRTLAIILFGGLVLMVAVPLFVESMSVRRQTARTAPQPSGKRPEDPPSQAGRPPVRVAPSDPTRPPPETGARNGSAEGPFPRFGNPPGRHGQPEEQATGGPDYWPSYLGPGEPRRPSQSETDA